MPTKFEAEKTLWTRFMDSLLLWRCLDPGYRCPQAMRHDLPLILSYLAPRDCWVPVRTRPSPPSLRDDFATSFVFALDLDMDTCKAQFGYGMFITNVFLSYNSPRRIANLVTGIRLGGTYLFRFFQTLIDSAFVSRDSI